MANSILTHQNFRTLKPVKNMKLNEYDLKIENRKEYGLGMTAYVVLSLLFSLIYFLSNL